MIQKPDTRRALLDAATSIVARQGLGGTSLRAICAQVGVQLPTLYHFFGDKQGLLDAVLADSLDRYLTGKRSATRAGDPRKSLRQGWDLHVGFARENPAIYPLMFPAQADTATDAARSTLERLEEGFQRLADAGLLRTGMTAGLATRSLSAALHGVAMTVAREPARRDNDKLSATVRDAVIDSLLIREPPA